MVGITNNTDVINIAIAGVGGQGVLTLAEILAKAALLDSHNVRVGEIHGMAQRGGHVVCTVRIGEKAKGPIVDSGTAHLVIGFEPVETLREIHLIRKDGIAIMNSHVQYPVAVSMGKAEYPSEDEIRNAIRKFTNSIHEFDAMKVAKEAGSSRSMNIVMFGAIIGSKITPIRKESAIQVVREAFPSRFEEINVSAFEAGFAMITQFMKE
ncbi:MAG: indolepyruvate oxidoreductase subunit beta [Candidatus Thorarchaeota archaeon]|nr:indolepyruvate oxidoreductase subunit beta [Candidatus Thorarchaeota archaeon]